MTPTITDLNSKLDQILNFQRAILAAQRMMQADVKAILATENDDAAIQALTDKLKASEGSLQSALDTNQLYSFKKENIMNPLLAALQAQVTANTNAEASATLCINGIAARIASAVAAALVNGATAAQLAPIQAEIDALNQSATAMSAAVVANTPVGP